MLETIGTVTSCSVSGKGRLTEEEKILITTSAYSDCYWATTLPWNGTIVPTRAARRSIKHFNSTARRVQTNETIFAGMWRTCSKHAVGSKTGYFYGTLSDGHVELKLAFFFFFFTKQRDKPVKKDYRPFFCHNHQEEDTKNRISGRTTDFPGLGNKSLRLCTLICGFTWHNKEQDQEYCGLGKDSAFVRTARIIKVLLFTTEWCSWKWALP